MNRMVALVCGLAGVWLLLSGSRPAPPDDGGGDIARPDAVMRAFDEYEARWRKLQGNAAERLDSGQLKTEVETREFLATADKEARMMAFDGIMRAEGDALNGRWTPERHAEVLRGRVQ